MISQNWKNTIRIISWWVKKFERHHIFHKVSLDISSCALPLLNDTSQAAASVEPHWLQPGTQKYDKKGQASVHLQHIYIKGEDTSELAVCTSAIKLAVAKIASLHLLPDTPEGIRKSSTFLWLCAFSTANDICWTAKQKKSFS